MSEINYEFRKRYSVVHNPNRRDINKKCPSDMIEVTGDWCISVPKDADAVLMNAARDLVDYFFTSMKVSLRLVCECEADKYEKKIVYGTDSKIKDYSYRFAVLENEIILCGQNSRMAAQAGYFLEDLMNLEEGPFVQKQNAVRTSLFNPRMVHSGYGLDMFPTEHLKNIAHAGISAILVFVKGVDTTPKGYEDFSDLCYRAAQYGIDVYAYAKMANRKHPDDPDAEEFYDNLYGKIWDRCPGFKGLIFVGESCEFPSKDEHTAMIRRLDNVDENGKWVGWVDKPYPGWWPCYDYPDLMNVVKKVVYKRRPDADIVLWSYNWCDAPAADRKALIDTMPKDIALQATFEMGETVMRDGVANKTVDYTLFFPGPGYYFSTEAEYAKENGLRFYSMTNTGGLTWDVGVIPYLPMPYQWIKRYEGMVNAHYKYGLVGTMDSHHFGFSPSFIGDLAKWAFHAPHVDLDETLHKLAARDFAPELADKVCEAYKLMSEGINHHISTNYDQYGPCRMGPSYPFVLFEHEDDIEIPTVPYAHFGGNHITCPVYGFHADANGFDLFKSEEEKAKFDYEIKNYRTAEDYYNRASEILESLLPSVPERKRENATRIAGLCKFIRNTMRTAIGIKEFAKLKFILKDTHGEKRNETVDTLLEICKAEQKNALDTIPLVEFDSRLGYEPSMEYMCDKAHIDWKLGLLHEVMEKELPSYYEK